jgi:hypothetical protein
MVGIIKFFGIDLKHYPRGNSGSHLAFYDPFLLGGALLIAFARVVELLEALPPWSGLTAFLYQRHRETMHLRGLI